ncbi:MAG: hypothetical protein AAGJ70_07635 [Pseudomonadota bacterium]
MRQDEPLDAAPTGAAEQETRVKLMAATPREFAIGMARLLRDMPHATSGAVTTIELLPGTVTVTYIAREGRRLSPLVVMPAADVTFVFTGVSTTARDAFISKFDKVFQRGGG